MGADIFVPTRQPGRDQLVLLGPQREGDLAQRQFGMILHAPDGGAAVADLGGLHRCHRIAGKLDRAGRRFANLVAMDCRRIPAGRTTGEQRKVAPRRRRASRSSGNLLWAIRYLATAVLHC